MKLRLDPNQVYAVALEGGGGRGAYEIGAWQAFAEAGLRFGAVAGTSVGALNGALMVMGDLAKATDVWYNIQMNQVLNVDEQREKDMRLLLAGKPSLGELFGALQRNAGLLKEGGLDVSPLRAWIRAAVDPETVAASSVDLYVTTVDVAEKKGLVLHVNELPQEDICDMLLASAYHPTFRQEPLGREQKIYADGGFFDSIPIDVLVDKGWKNILAVRLPGIGLERPVKLPEDVTVTTVETNKDLGSVLLFDAAQSRRNLRIGYLDACRTLYGLAGETFYVERTLTEPEAWARLAAAAGDGPEEELRQRMEKKMAQIAADCGVRRGAGYYETWLAALEEAAVKVGLDPLVLGILKDTELETRVRAARDPAAELRRLILASASPRRKSLLTMAGIPFTVQPASIEETVPEGMPALEQSEYLALLKASSLADAYPDRVILGADTTVIVDGQVLGKPKDEEEARAFLRLLSGRTHIVCTGAALVQGARQESFSSAAEVEFYELTDEEIDAYVATGEPMDKAGAYAVQGAGFRFVKRIHGDYYTVVGLPLAETVRRLEAFRKES